MHRSCRRASHQLLNCNGADTQKVNQGPSAGCQMAQHPLYGHDPILLAACKEHHSTQQSHPSAAKRTQRIRRACGRKTAEQHLCTSQSQPHFNHNPHMPTHSISTEHTTTHTMPSLILAGVAGQKTACKDHSGKAVHMLTAPTHRINDLANMQLALLHVQTARG